MIQKKKTLKSGFSIDTIGLGTWGIGGFREADYSRDKENIEILKKAIELGYKTLDIAELYGNGHTEELVAEAIKEMNRSELFLISKVFTTNLKYDEVLDAAKKSLKRLQTDYIDLYLIHAPSPETPIQETMKAMNELVDLGLVKYIGVSNFQVHELEEAQKYSKHKLVVNQIEYSLLTRNKGNYTNRDMESKMVPYCQENDIIIMAERPVERGALLEDIPLMNELAEKYNKTKAQIAINWLISKENIVTIPKSVDENHLKENLGSLDFEMDKEDHELLDQFPNRI